MTSKKSPSQKSPVAMMQIGASKESIKEARQAINEILKAPHIDNSTKVVALNALSVLCEVKNTSITGCNFQA